MKKFAAFLLWSAVFVAIVLVTDQLFVRFDPKLPVLSEVRAFYVDFRTRLLGLDPTLPKLPDWSAASAKKPEPQPAERPPTRPPATKPEATKPTAAKAPAKAAPPAAKPAPAPAVPADGFVYADAKGELHFAATLDEVPPAFRSKAQPLVR